jgi:hypothetical protein
VNEDRLRQHLADKAAGVDATPGDPASLKTHAANPLLVMGAGLALVTLLGAGLAWLLPAADGEIAVDTTETTLALAQGSADEATSSLRPVGGGSDLPAITAGDGPTLTWQGGQFTEGVWISGIIAYGDGYLAWGQETADQLDYEAGERPSFRLWRSSDGLEWSDIEAQGFGVEGDFWINSMLATDERLVAVGVAFDPPQGLEDGADSHFRPGTERTILMTSADGVSWETTEFTAQQSGPTANPGEHWSSGEPMLAARGDVVVLLSTSRLDFDPYLIIEERLAAEGLEIGGMSWGPDEIEVFGFEGDEVIATFTPEELGVDPEVLEHGGGPLETRSNAYISVDGGVTFTEHATSGLDEVGYLNGIVTTTDGFVVSGEQILDSGYVGGAQATWRSADGVAWTRGDPLADGWFSGLASYGDFIVGAGDNLIVSFDAGATFNRVEGPAFDPVADLQFNVELAKTGPFGTIATGSGWQPGPPPPPLEVEVDGLIYREVYGDDPDEAGPLVTVTDAATGEVVFSKHSFWQPEHITYGADGDEFLTFNSPETGEPLMRVSWQELEQNPFGSDATTIERDGLTFTIDFGDEDERVPHVVIVDSASGEVLFDVENVFTPSYIEQDDTGYTILDLDTGEPVMRIDYEDLERSYADAEFYTEPEMAMWFSPDGRAWSRQSMTEAFGDSGWTQAMAVGIDRVIVTFQPYDQFGPLTEEEAQSYVPPPTQVWVGTLP